MTNFTIHSSKIIKSKERERGVVVVVVREV